MTSMMGREESYHNRQHRTYCEFDQEIVRSGKTTSNWGLESIGSGSVVLRHNPLP